MQPITQPASLQPGATLYHSAFGFATVREVGPDAVSLDWEREGTHLPGRVRFDALSRVYAECTAQGFFHRALHEPDTLANLVHQRPSEAVVLLLEDLEGPQRVRDLMDWLVGRNLFTPKTFVRWWGTAEAPLKGDTRLHWEGEWVQRAVDPGSEAGHESRLVQLEPNLVDARDHLQGDPSDTTFPPEDYGTDEQSGLVAHFVTVAGPTSLAEMDLPAFQFIAVGRAMAEALARFHDDDRVVSPHLQGTLLLPDGTIRLEQGEAPAPQGPPLATSPAEDIRRGAIVLMEAFLGRHIPPGAAPQSVLPFLRHRLQDLPPTALAPMYEALAEDPTRRPTATEWADAWRKAEIAELDRGGAFDPDLLLDVGYDSHVGRVKLLQTQTNQDALWTGARGTAAMSVLCDGISVADAGRGDIASKLGTQAIARLWENVPAGEVQPRRIIERGYQLANRAICERALKAAGGDLTYRLPMGTTVVSALSHGNRIHLAWLGDSRAYLVGPFGVSQLTADDNVAGEHFILWCEHRGRAWDSTAHALTRYLGHFDEAWEPAAFPVHHAEFTLRSSESLVLCSDGVTDYVAREEADVAARIREALADASPFEAAQRLVRMANEGGGGDNATAMVLRVAPPQVDVTAW